MGGNQDRQGFLPPGGPGCDGDYGGRPKKWKTVYVEEVKNEVYQNTTDKTNGSGL